MTDVQIKCVRCGVESDVRLCDGCFVEKVLKRKVSR